MRKITANYVYPVVSAPIKNAIIVLNDNDEIVDLINPNGKLKEIEGLEFYGGMIVPGFVDIFSLLSWANFSKNDFDLLVGNKELNELEKYLQKDKQNIQAEQRTINHFEAFGTKAVADYFSSDIAEEKKKKSKVDFYDTDLHSIDFPNLKSDKSILLNEYTFSAIDDITSFNFDKICIGTGSLNMFKTLSILEQMIKIQEHFIDLSVLDIIKFGTYNSAQQIGAIQKFGSIEIGKKPGLNLICDFDASNWKLKQETELKVLI